MYCAPALPPQISEVFLVFKQQVLSGAGLED